MRISTDPHAEFACASVFKAVSFSNIAWNKPVASPLEGAPVRRIDELVQGPVTVRAHDDHIVKRSGSAMIVSRRDEFEMVDLNTQRRTVPPERHSCKAQRGRLGRW
jgi:hypothetical protein